MFQVAYIIYIFVPKAETDLFQLQISATGYLAWLIDTHNDKPSLNSNPDSTNLAVPKLCDDGSNWADYSS